MQQLSDARYLSLATWRRDGREVRTPVWFANDGEATLYIFSAGEAGKVKRLRALKRAAVASCDVRGGSLGTWIEARGYIVKDASEIERAYALLKGKYGIQMTLTNLFSWLGRKIHKRAIIRVELDRVRSGGT